MGLSLRLVVGEVIDQTRMQVIEDRKSGNLMEWLERGECIRRSALLRRHPGTQQRRHEGIEPASLDLFKPLFGIGDTAGPKITDDKRDTGQRGLGIQLDDLFRRASTLRRSGHRRA